ncbi:MAG: hypothetical protein AAF581_09380 [Planctomycetota bacterium]
MAKLKTEDYAKRLETAQAQLKKAEGGSDPDVVRRAKKYVKRAQRGIRRLSIAAKHAARRDKKPAGDS